MKLDLNNIAINANSASSKKKFTLVEQLIMLVMKSQGMSSAAMSCVVNRTKASITYNFDSSKTREPKSGDYNKANLGWKLKYLEGDANSVFESLIEGVSQDKLKGLVVSHFDNLKDVIIEDTKIGKERSMTTDELKIRELVKEFFYQQFEITEEVEQAG